MPASIFHLCRVGDSRNIKNESGSLESLLLAVRMERGLPGTHLRYQFLDPIKRGLIGDPRRQALVMLDLLVDLYALLTHCSTDLGQAGKQPGHLILYDE
jgi:hypothetical protein